MCVAKVKNIALQSELFLRAWRYGAGFAVRHHYLSLCTATFPTMSLVNALILPMPHGARSRYSNNAVTLIEQSAKKLITIEVFN